MNQNERPDPIQSLMEQIDSQPTRTGHERWARVPGSERRVLGATLFLHRQTCDNCGAVETYSSGVAFRVLTHSKETVWEHRADSQAMLFAHATLPRTVRTLQAAVDFCGRCWQPDPQQNIGASS